MRRSLSQVDVILGVGLDSVDFVTSTWEFETPVVSTNLSGANDPALKPAAAVDGNLMITLDYLLDRVEHAKSEKAAIHRQVAMLREGIEHELRSAQTHKIPGTVPVESLVDGLLGALPEDGVVTIDVGLFKLFFLQQWKTDTPGSLLVANGLSAMGYALPGALAVKLEKPEVKTVAVVGDGALLMYAGELATIARQRLPMVILVVIDDALSLIRLKQLRHDGLVHGTEFGRVDFGSLARSFGLEYRLMYGQEDSGTGSDNERARSG